MLNVVYIRAVYKYSVLPVYIGYVTYIANYLIAQ